MKRKQKYILGNSFNLLVVIGVVFSVVMFLVKRPMLYLLGASKNIYGYADSYLTIYICGTLFVMLSLGMNAFINAQGFANIGMMTVSIGAVCNLILDQFLFLKWKWVYRERSAGNGDLAVCKLPAGHSGSLPGKKATIRLDKNYLKLKTDRVKKRFLCSVYPVLLCR